MDTFRLLNFKNGEPDAPGSTERRSARSPPSFFANAVTITQLRRFFNFSTGFFAERPPKRVGAAARITSRSPGGPISA
jgi:hypothetical protein